MGCIPMPNQGLMEPICMCDGQSTGYKRDVVCCFGRLVFCETGKHSNLLHNIDGRTLRVRYN